MKLTSSDAFELSRSFRDLSVGVGSYRFDNWDKLKPSQRQDLEDLEWSLLNGSSDIRTMAVGLMLDETQLSFVQLKGSTGKAKNAIKKLKTVKKVINMATRAVALGAAVVSKDFGAVLKNSKALHELVKK